MNAAGQTICLSIIVKNEQPVLRRCLGSVLPLLDTWAVVDTGSTDGTQELVRECLGHLPGELFERPWVNFAHNRTESLMLGRGRADYQLIIDADEYLDYDPGFSLPELTADAYEFPMRSGNLSYYKTQLVRSTLPWRYIGVLHEYVACEQALTLEPMHGLRTMRLTDGARSRDAMTYRRDALLLEEALLTEPGNARHMFYLAQSYADAQEPQLAIDRYARRAAMGGWYEEVWLSLYQVAYLKQKTGAPWAEVLAAHLAAYACRQDRAEPLFRIGMHYQEERNYAAAHLFFARAVAIPFPAADRLYVEREIYDYYLPLEYGVACFYVGQHREAVGIAARMLGSGLLTREQEDRVLANRRFSLDALASRLKPPRPADEAPPGQVCVCLFFEGELPTLARRVESLSTQPEPLRAVLVDATSDGSASAALIHAEVPKRLTVVRCAPEKVARLETEEPASWGACLALAAQQAAPEDILLLLPQASWLAADRSVAELPGIFATQGCSVLYGQFRWAGGRIGDVLPFLSPEELYLSGAAQLPLLPLACRRSLLDEIALTPATQPIDLLRAAGFARLRFHDGVLAIRAEEAAR